MKPIFVVLEIEEEDFVFLRSLNDIVVFVEWR